MTPDLVRRVARRISNTGLLMDAAWDVSVERVLSALSTDDLVELLLAREGVEERKHWIVETEPVETIWSGWAEPGTDARVLVVRSES